VRVLDAATHRTYAGGPSFTVGNRLFRVVWGAAWLLLARWTPAPLHGWRRLVLRAFGARVAPGVQVYGSVRIWHPGNLEIGENTMIGRSVTVYNQGRITIGARTMISQRAHLCASTHDVNDPHFQLQLRPIRIGNQCWVAAEAFVGPGVTMSDGAVLGARGALFTDAEPMGIYRGNPATKVKIRRLRDA
jgi:putative colanic acid biosynthesis acetyltransferase WcaF